MFQHVEIDNAHNIGKGRALVGCGGTSEIRVSTHTATFRQNVSHDGKKIEEAIRCFFKNTFS